MENTTETTQAAPALQPVATEAELLQREKVALKDGRGGYIGIKAGMTQVYDGEGNLFAVTVIDLRPNVVTQVRNKDKDGYVGVQVGILPKKQKSAIKPEAGHAKKSGAHGFQYIEEIRFPENAKLEGVECGKVLSIDFLKEGDLVDLSGVSKGKGFQGVIKRHHFGGGNASHGNSVSHRAPGSIGNRADPGRVFKNRKMAGHMGHENLTVQNVRVIKVDADNGVLLVHGSVPGPKSSVVMVRKAIKGQG